MFSDFFSVFVLFLRFVLIDDLIVALVVIPAVGVAGAFGFPAAHIQRIEYAGYSFIIFLRIIRQKYQPRHLPHLYTRVYASDDKARRFFESFYCRIRFCLASENGTPVYEYCFSKKNGRLGPWHSGEMMYFYGNIPATSSVFDDSDRALSKTVMAYIKNFATSNDPNGAGLPAWEQSKDSTRLLKLDTTVEMADEPFLAFYDILDRMQGWGE